MIKGEQMHIRINLNEDGTATYFRWLDDEEDYDFRNPLPSYLALKAISQGATADITALDPDDSDRVFEGSIKFYGG
jgi:hypothetical protein